MERDVPLSTGLGVVIEHIPRRCHPIATRGQERQVLRGQWWGNCQGARGGSQARTSLASPSRKRCHGSEEANRRWVLDIRSYTHMFYIIVDCKF
jgi:hypothetical protein